MRASTLVDILRQRAFGQSDVRAYTFLADEEERDALTYAELDRRARGVAALLQQQTRAGERALLCFPPGLDFIHAFFGCLYAGVIAVPAYPPANARHLPRLRAIAGDAQASLILTTGKTFSRIRDWLAETPGLSQLRVLVADEGAPSAHEAWREFTPQAGTLAMLQYTSGSTSEPRGVMVSHANLLANSVSINEGFRHSGDSVSVTWLPTFHDMGLIDGVLQPLYSGFPCYMMAPTAFLQSPARWLRAICRYRATHSGGPNFAYDLCLRKITPEQCAGIALNSWRVAYNGAEPVLSHTLEGFAEKFGPYGFRRAAFYPCYGLAEATLKVSGPLTQEGPVLCTVDSEALGEHRAVEVSREEAGGRTLVGCGVAASDSRIVIVDPERRTACGPGQVGEIWFSGPGLAGGYWNRREATETTFRAFLSDTGDGPFLRTGDLGFMRDGELFVTGRIKDVIIIRGRNHYPQDIELTARQSHPALNAGMGAAFSVAVDGEEQLVIVQEVETRGRPDTAEVIGRILEAVAAEHDLSPLAVVLVRPRSVPRTSSGKVQRRACREGFLGDTLEVVAEERRASGAPVSAVEPRLASTRPPSAPDAARLVAKLVARRLGREIEEIDLDVPVSRYGMDSLAAVELAHAFETQTGVRLPATTLLRPASIRQLAAEISAATDGSSERQGVSPALTHEAATDSPLSYGQQSLWVIHQLAPQSAAYNLTFAARLLSPVEAPTLREALQAVVNRHPSLRTTYPVVEGEPRQQVNEHLALAFKEVEASGMSDEELNGLLVEESRRPFNLGREAPLRAALFTRADGETILLLVTHHLAVDARSLEIILRELAALYSQDGEAPAHLVAAPALCYTDYTRWQRELLAGEGGERLWRYWSEQLSGTLPTVELPLSRSPRPAVQTYNGGVRHQRINASLSRSLRRLAQEHDTTAFVVAPVRLLCSATPLHRARRHHHRLSDGGP